MLRRLALGLTAATLTACMGDVGAATGGGSGGGAIDGGAAGGAAANGGGGGSSSAGGGSAGGAAGGMASGGGTAAGGGATGGGAATGGGGSTGGGSATPDGGGFFRPNKLLSVGAPVTASASTSSSVALAFDGRVDTGAWVGNAPAANGTVSDSWVRVQLGTGTPCVGPSSVLLVWHSVGDPDYVIDTAVNYNTPTGYTIETSADGTQWTQVVNVSSDTTTYRARSHRLDFSGQCYVRFTMTQMKSGQGQRTPQIDELFIYDVSQSNDDTWIFLGDGPNRFAYDQHFAPSFTDMVATKHPAYTPAMLDAADLGGQVSDVQGYLPAFLALNPGFDKWVLALGLDEAQQGTPASTDFVANMQGLIDLIEAQGHQVLIPHLRYTSTSQYPHLAQYNAAIDQLVSTNGLLPAPDLYTLFQASPALLCSSANDCESNWEGIAPADPSGYQAENQAWADALDRFYAP